MNLAQVLFPDGVPSDLTAWGIVMSEAQRNTLVARQDSAGLNRHRVSPVALTDGRYAVKADVLSEAHPNGVFSRVDLVGEGDLTGVSVMAWADVVALLPVPESPI